MNKLITLLLATMLAASTSAFATDAAKPAAAPTAPAASAAPTAQAAPATVKGPAVGEAVTPQNDAAALHEIIAKMKADDHAKKASAKK